MLVGELPEARREGDHDHASRNAEERGLEGREADELQIELHEDELRVQSAVDEERLEVRHREVAPPEEIEGEHRVLRACLDEAERDERGHRDRERPPDVAEALVRSLDEPVRQRPEGECCKCGARYVEPPDPQHLLLVALAGLREHDGERGERKVDEEDPAP